MKEGRAPPSNFLPCGRGWFPPPFPQTPIPLAWWEGDDGSHPPWHQPCRAPSHDRASPSSIKTLPTELPPRDTVRSLRPYLSSSRSPAARESFPALSSVSRRDFAASPFIRSTWLPGGLSSGVSMSAIGFSHPRTRRCRHRLRSSLDGFRRRSKMLPTMNPSSVSWPKWRNRGERQRRHRQANLQQQ